MSLSIIIPAHNEAGQIEHTLNSILNNGLNFDETEVIVVGSNCSDDTLGIAERVLDEDCRVKEHQILESGIGQQVAQNVGIAAARASFVISHDADVVSDPGTISQLHKTLEENPEVKLVGPLVVMDSKELPVDFPLLSKVMLRETIRRGCLGTRKSVTGGCFGFSVDAEVVFPVSSTPNDSWISADIVHRYGLEGVRILMNKRTQSTPPQNWLDYISTKSRYNAGFGLLELEFPELAYTVQLVTEYIEKNRSREEIDRRWAEECARNGIDLVNLFPTLEKINRIVKNLEQITIDDLVGRAGTWDVIKSTKLPVSQFV